MPRDPRKEIVCEASVSPLRQVPEPTCPGQIALGLIRTQVVLALSVLSLTLVAPPILEQWSIERLDSQVQERTLNTLPRISVRPLSLHKGVLL